VAHNTFAIVTTTLESEKLVEEAFLIYRNKGFPYYALTPDQKFQKLSQLRNYSHSNLIVDGDIIQRMHGLALAWSYFPASWSVRCGSMKSPLDVFNSDKDLRGAIAKHIKFRSEPITDAAIRRVVRFFSGAQGVSNFRPTAAAAIYHTFLPSTGGKVWDMSSGFGGRLLGAIACNRVSGYVGTDPCSQTMTGLRTMAGELGRDGLEIELQKMGSEDFLPDRNSFDLCFSSPPYFDAEKYSCESTQSYLKYPDKDSWLHGFLGTTLDNCRRGLKPSGRLIVNIANVSSYPTLENDFVGMACSRGWKLECKLHYALSRMMGTRRPDGESFRYEPVFVFKKKA
jgi:hypothetical protein